MKLARTIWWNFPALIRSPIFLAFWGVIALWAVAAYFIPPSNLLIAVNAVRLVFSVAVAVAFFPAAIVYVLQGHPMRHGYLAIGICGSWAAEGLLGLVVLVRRLFEFPWWIPESIIALLILGSAGCAVLHLTARALREGDTDIPKQEWVLTGILAAVGIGLAVILIWLFSTGQFADGGIAFLQVAGW
jgi:hypothetical protein